MRTDNRLSLVLHVLLHLDESKELITSQMIGKMLNMNPSVVRRTMGGLRDAELVGSTKGHRGGWFLVKPLNSITLADVYEALGEPNLFALGTAEETPTCLLEQAANTATKSALGIARESFSAFLSSVTVASLADEKTRKEILAFQHK